MVQHITSDSDSANLRKGRSHTAVSPLLPRFLRLALPFLLVCLPFSARADDGLTPVHLRIAGREIRVKTASLADERETYVPLEALEAVGATGQINRRGDAVLVTLTRSQERAELALAQINGQPMIALSDLAQLLDAVVDRPDKLDEDGKPLAGTPGDTVYLLARVTDARLENGVLRVTTSFPVPYRARMLSEMKPPRGLIDCVGAAVGKDFRPAPLPEGERRALRLRAGQFTDEVARIVVELNGGCALVPSTSITNAQTTIQAALTGTGSETKAADARLRRPGAVGATDERAAGEGQPEPDPRNQSGSQTVPPSGSAAQKAPSTPKPRGRGAWASRGGKAVRAPVAIRALTFAEENETRARLVIETSGKASAYVHYLRGAKQMAVDIPNAILSLAAPTGCDQTFTHPLVSALHAVMAQEAPPMARVTLEMNRVVGFSLNAQNDKLVLELRLPRSATGALAGKLIVVDPGHGGSSTGATGHGAGYTVYEKNITLAIALKLRTALEACGARVVMTRERDMDVPLYDRPRLANSIGADLFISIHNDSNGQPNSASGTSTYYHMGDPSSRALAVCVQEAVCAVTGLPNRGALSDGILYASGLAVLRTSRMPAVLCEVAYINNAYDRHKLMDPEFQQRVAQAICDGIRAYIEGTKQVASARPVGPEARLSETAGFTGH